MTALLARKPDLVIGLLAVYFLVNILVRVTLPHALELDEAEQVFFSQFLAAGYGAQPPFYNWLYYSLASITGPSVLSLAVLKSGLLFSSYMLYDRAGRLLIDNPLLAALSTLGLLTIPQIAFEAQRDLTHTVGVIFAASLFFYGMARTLKTPDLLAYALTGVAIGIGLMAKYNFALLAGAAFLALLANPVGRRRVFDARLAITLLLAGIILVPHTLWLVDHFGEASSQTLGKMTDAVAMAWPIRIGAGLLSLAFAAIGFSTLTILVFFASFRRKLIHSRKSSNMAIRIVGLTMAISMLALVVMVLFTQTTTIRDRWLTPVLMLLPLYLAMKLDAARVNPDPAAKRFFIAIAFIMIIVPLALNLRITLGGAFGHYEKLNVPYAPFAAELLEKQNIHPAAILAADRHLAGNMALNWPSGPVMSASYPGFAPALTLTADRPLLIVWRARGQVQPPLPGIITQWLKTRPEFKDAAIEPQFLALPYHYGRNDDRYGFGYAVVAPTN